MMIPQKPENSRWTDDQWRAITTEGHDLLVAAAAGSGKTAVLVARIIRKITDHSSRASLDNLLVVTFTKAAAAEMRERIGQAIEQRLTANPSDLYLRRQQTLLGKASIMTLHAFCSSIIRSFYYKLDLDPGFRLADEAESALIREEVLDEVLEQHYQAGQDAFFDLVARYSGDRGDDGLRQLIFRVYDFSRSAPWPEEWLDRMETAYRKAPEASIDAMDWARDLKCSIARQIEEARVALKEALNGCREAGGPAVYADTIETDLAALDALPDCTSVSWDASRQAVCALSFARLKTCRDKTVNAALKETVQKLRKEAKDRISDLQTLWFRQASSESLADMADMAASVTVLRQVIGDFSAAYTQEKRRRGLLDFNDLEHNCLAVLRDQKASPGNERPSEVARYYQAMFSEILIDEYQDTNRVQETILSLIAQQEPSGNRFMVGDVKQSIYGFRLADPGLFLDKYKQFSRADSLGEKIDLSSNFRSRQEVIYGTNFIFRQIMDQRVGGIAYDSAAELTYGATYPEYASPVDVVLIDREQTEEDEKQDDEREASAIEAEAIADRIAAMIGDGKTGAYQVLDQDSGTMRAVRYRDMAILLRAASSTAPIIMEALQQRAIPAYAELSNGYFDTIEVTVMLAALQIIDNPLQDIPLTAVLRSPLFKFSGDALAEIRIQAPHASYFEALQAYGAAQKGELADRVLAFFERLTRWREASKRLPVSQLIWQIYRDSGYFDYVGGLAGGTQRQANLQALYDRARQYEQTSFRGLFRFLRFISRLRETGGDMGEARALSEQADVVRVMTIHKSKGLEFPIVFIAGLGKSFNTRDLAAPALLHPSIGFGTRWIDPEQRISLPTLLYLAIQDRLRTDSLAEEMRILYVALTRAREKLIVLATCRSLASSLTKWGRASRTDSWLLPEPLRRSATAFIDWIGSSLIRHPAADDLVDTEPSARETEVARDPSSWVIQRLPAAAIHAPALEMAEREKTRFARLRAGKTVVSFSAYQDEVAQRLSWHYPFERATHLMAKQTVTEIKAHQDYFSEGRDDRLLPEQENLILGDRPRFLQKTGLTAAERGTAVHVLMQHLDLRQPLTIAELTHDAQTLVTREILTDDEAGQIDFAAIARFFAAPLGQQLQHADYVSREVPFSLSVDPDEIYPPQQQTNDPAREAVLIQGVIDCIFESAEGLTILDYKTDHLRRLFPQSEAATRELRKRYHTQLALYKLAIERIWKRSVDRVFIYSFDCDLAVAFGDGEGERQ
ncbi:MAG: helicase-exonuclease AddAB subunit AddA [Sporolactobacillus sp.]